MENTENRVYILTSRGWVTAGVRDGRYTKTFVPHAVVEAFKEKKSRVLLFDGRDAHPLDKDEEATILKGAEKAVTPDIELNVTREVADESIPKEEAVVLAALVGLGGFLVGVILGSVMAQQTEVHYHEV